MINPEDGYLQTILLEINLNNNPTECLIIYYLLTVILIMINHISDLCMKMLVYFKEHWIIIQIISDITRVLLHENNLPLEFLTEYCQNLSSDEFFNSA